MMGDMTRSKAQTTKNQADVIIIGGGLAGLTLAGLLGRNGIDVICLDRDPPAAQLSATFDGRTTAISYGSRQILEQSGVWDMLEDEGHGACAIETIDILDGASARVALQFDSAEAGNMFGWIVENRDFRACLYRHVQTLPSVRHIAPAAAAGFIAYDDHAEVTTTDGQVYTAKLVIGADGRNSAVRDWAGIGTRAWPYKQQAIVCTVAHDHPHRHVAVEHFRPEGPFAILPMTDDAQGQHRSSVVWTVEQAAKSSPLDWPEDVFNTALTARFPERYGEVRLIGKRFAFPLGLIHAHDYVGTRVALVADAAHGIHPIAGQGLNLGLRDVADLAEKISGAEDAGDAAVLSAYQRNRRLDNVAMAGATDILNHLFSNDMQSVALMRRAGIAAVSRSKTAKRFFMKQAMGMKARANR